MKKASKKAAKKPARARTVVVFCNCMTASEKKAVISSAKMRSYDVKTIPGTTGTSAALTAIVQSAKKVIIVAHYGLHDDARCRLGGGLQELRNTVRCYRGLFSGVEIEGRFVYPDPTQGDKLVAEVVN